MSDIIRCPNGNALLLIPRSGSHSLATAALQVFYPDIDFSEATHPAQCWPVSEHHHADSSNVALVVRNPIERFRSMVAHRRLDVNEQLANPMYGPLPTGTFVRHFRFEDQLQACANWLGITVPLPQIDATEEIDKPTLTEEQELRVREIYAADIVLWESL